MARRAYVTFSEGQTYEGMRSVLERSIENFSVYPLVTYSASDFDEVWNPEFWPAGYAYKFKILACLKALRDYDEIVWIDTDVVVTQRIDDIWRHELTNYPLLPKYRFENFIRWPQARGDMRNSWELTAGKQKVGLDHTDFENLYCQACAMLVNRRCESFLRDVLSYFDDFDSECFPFGDETIINLLKWKYGYRHNLGDIFLCTGYFSSIHIMRSMQKVDNQSYQDIFNPGIVDADEDNLYLVGGDYRVHNRLGIIDCSRRPLFLHGSKSADEQESYLQHLISIQNG